MKKIFLLFMLTFLFVGCKKEDEPTSPKNTDCSPQLEAAVSCKAELPPCDGAQLSSSVQCLGKTTSNNRCNNKTLSKCGYCHLHTNQWNYICPNKTKNACGYCDDHIAHYSK
jgi:hypothetical protein